MQINKISSADLFFPRIRAAVLIFLFIAALGIRLYHLFDPPLDFASNRQYHSFVIARNYYFQSSPTIPAWRKEVAELNVRQTAQREPRIYEYFISRLYCLAGGEYLWLPAFFLCPSGWLAVWSSI